MKTGIIVVIALAAAVASCKKSPTGPSTPNTPPASIVGTWRATSAEFVSDQSSSLRAEVVSRGATMVAVFESATCTWTFAEPGGMNGVNTGTWTLGSGDDGIDRLKVTWTSGYLSGDSVFKSALSGNTLTLTDGSMSYDFTHNGISPDDVARLNVTFARQ